MKLNVFKYLEGLIVFFVLIWGITTSMVGHCETMSEVWSGTLSAELVYKSTRYANPLAEAKNTIRGFEITYSRGAERKMVTMIPSMGLFSRTFNPIWHGVTGNVVVPAGDVNLSQSMNGGGMSGGAARNIITRAVSNDGWTLFSTMVTDNSYNWITASTTSLNQTYDNWVVFVDNVLIGIFTYSTMEWRLRQPTGDTVSCVIPTNSVWEMCLGPWLKTFDLPITGTVTSTAKPTASVYELVVNLGTTPTNAEWVSGVSGRWGITTTKTIPPYGGVYDITTGDAVKQTFCDASGKITSIGEVWQILRVDEVHDWSVDSNFIDVGRVVSSRTTQAPELTAKVIAGSVNAMDEIITSTTNYNPNGVTVGTRGIEGWVNYPITISSQSSAINGNYKLLLEYSSNGLTNPNWTLSSPGGESVSTVSKTITRSNFTPTTTPSNLTGCAFRSRIRDNGGTGNILSGTSTLNVKYDGGQPSAALGYSNGRFVDNSSDALSGVRGSETKIMFRNPGTAGTPAMNDSNWKSLSSYTLPNSGTNFDVWVLAFDKAGNYNINLAYPNRRIHEEVGMSVDTNKGAVFHAKGCPNRTSTDIITGAASNCLAGCHAGTQLQLIEGSIFNYKYTLRSTDVSAGANGTYENWLPVGVVPTGSGLVNITSTSGTASVTVNIAAAPEPADSAHAGQYKINGNYTLGVAAGGDTLQFELACRVPGWNSTAGAANSFANQEGTVTFTMGDGYNNSAGILNSAVHKVGEGPKYDLTFSKTVSGEYARTDLPFSFSMDFKQSWGVPINGTFHYTSSGGVNPVTGNITISGGSIIKVNGESGTFLTLTHGQSITIKELPENCSYTITQVPITGYTTTETVDGAGYGHTTAGVVTGSLLADTAVAYNNDRSILPVPTGIAGPGGSTGILKVMLGGIAAVYGGIMFYNRKKRRNGISSLLALVLILTIGLAFAESRVYAASGNPTLIVGQTFDVKDGKPLINQFTYHLKAVTPGAPMPGGGTGDYVFQIAGTNDLVLPAASYTLPGVYVYQLSLKEGEVIAGYNYDKAVYTLEVIVSAGAAGISTELIVKNPEGEKCQKPAFIQRYEPKASDPTIIVDPPVKKQVTGTPKKAGTFKFTLTAEHKENPMPKGSKDGRKIMTIVGVGEKDFGTWPYTKTGTYRYTIAETDVGEAGYTYDNTVYTITDVVTDQDGILHVNRTTADGAGMAVTEFIFTNQFRDSSGGGGTGDTEPGDKNTPPGGGGVNSGGGNINTGGNNINTGFNTINPGSNGLVKTGDNTPLILWGVLFTTAGLGITGTVVYYNRRKKRKKGELHDN